MKQKYEVNELQNENLYLYAHKNSLIVKEILFEQLRFKWGGKRYKEFYAEAIAEYNKLINLIARFIKELNLDNNAIILCMILKKLIFRGYFSKDNKFDSRKNGMFYDVNFLEGMDIVAGMGCCRHFAGFYSDIFKKLGLFNYIFTCYFGDGDCSLDEAFLESCNHAANLIKYEDVIYCYDCYSNVILKSIDGFTMSEISGGNVHSKKDNYKFFYKPSASVMMSNNSYEEALNMIEMLKENCKKDVIDYNIYLQFLEEIAIIFYSNTELFADLKFEAKKYTKKIATHLRDGQREYIDSLY